jgi:hypothetical protein
MQHSHHGVAHPSCHAARSGLWFWFSMPMRFRFFYLFYCRFPSISEKMNLATLTTRKCPHSQHDALSSSNNKFSNDKLK